MSRLARWRYGLAGLLCLALPQGAKCEVLEQRPFSAQVAVSATTVFDPKVGSCERGFDVADAPARAFRDDHGFVHLIATNHHNRAMIGLSLTQTSHSCPVIYKASEDLSPQSYNDYGWLTSFYTKNGKDVYALVHNEFHAFESRATCPSGDRVNCIEYSITSAVSKDSGKTFSRSKPKALVAALPYKFDPMRHKLSGYSNPSDIIKHDGFYYVLLPSLDPLNHLSGVCLMRTSNIEDQSSWVGWDGNAFSIRFENPYNEPQLAEKQKPCQPVGNGNLFYSLGSVSYYRPGNIFVAVMRKGRWDRQLPNQPSGIYLSTSTDLLNWSPPSLALADNTAYPDGHTDMLYPSLLDPYATDRNFVNITAHPLLFTSDAVQGASFDTHKLVHRQVTISLP